MAHKGPQFSPNWSRKNEKAVKLKTPGLCIYHVIIVTVLSKLAKMNFYWSEIESLPSVGISIETALHCWKKESSHSLWQSANLLANTLYLARWFMGDQIRLPPTAPNKGQFDTAFCNEKSHIERGISKLQYYHLQSLFLVSNILESRYS